MQDLVFPKNNEEFLVRMAERLGIKHLILCYPLSDPLIKERSKEVAMLRNEKLTTEFAIKISSQSDVSKAKTLTSTIVAPAQQEFFEDKRISHIIDMESGRRDDFIHHRNSGLNQVFIEHALRTNKTFVVNAHLLLYGERAQSVILGRILQNNMMFRKYRPRILVASCAHEPLEMRSPIDLARLQLL